MTLEPAVRREIVALTLPDLARVSTVAATLEQLVRAADRQRDGQRDLRREPQQGQQ